MQKIFFSTDFLDKKALECGLTEDILMENAAAALEKEVEAALKKRINSLPPVFCTGEKLSVLIVCGGGNNGGDGWALARRIHGKSLSRGCFVQATVYEAKPPKSAACIMQSERAKKYGVPVCREPAKFDTLLQTCAVLVECLIGSGLSGDPDKKTASLIGSMNGERKKNPACFFLACDIPGGITKDGIISAEAFIADKTVVMGAHKIALFSDAAKEYTGELVVADLGISRAFFEQETGANPQDNLAKAGSRDGGEAILFLLDEADLTLPVRCRQNVHKGSYGHAAVFSGEKQGAALLAARAAGLLGAGLVTLIHTLPNSPFSTAEIPHEIMQNNSVPTGENSLCAGMGFGRENPAADWFFEYATEKTNIPCVIDADLLYHPKLPDLLEKRKNLILTPHPKEFAALLALCGVARQTPSVPLTVSQTAEHRVELCAAFCAKYPDAVLLLKGANSLICMDKRIFINTVGTSALAKGGSGDILAGFIVSLLAQGYEPFYAAVNASLVHALAARRTGVTYSLTPEDLFTSVKNLEFFFKENLFF